MKSTDIDIDKVGFLALTSRDRRIAKQMLGRDLWKEGDREEEWRKDLQLMQMLNLKAEIQILSSGEGGLEEWLDRKLTSALAY